MKKTTFYILFLSFFIQLEILATQKILDHIIVRIEDDVIFESDLNLAYLQYIAQLGKPKNPLETKKQILTNLINSKIFLKYASTREILNEKMVDIVYKDRLKQMLSKFNNSKKDLTKALQMNYLDLKQLIKKNVKEQLTIKSIQDKINKNTKVTIEDIKEYLQKNPDRIPNIPRSFILKKYIFKPQITKVEKEKILSKVKAIKQNLKQGEDFKNLVLDYSNDEKTKFNGGEVGYYWKKGELTPEYEKATSKLKVLISSSNQLKYTSPIVETPIGFYLIQLLKVNGCKYYTRHILIKPKNMKTQIENIKHNLITKISNYNKNINDLENFFDTDEAFKDIKLQVEYLKNKNNQIRLLSNEIPQYLKKRIKHINQVIGPNEIEKKNGEKHIELIYVEDIIDERRANIKFDYYLLHDIVLHHKKEIKTNEWLKNQKKNITIQISEKYRKVV